MASNQQLVANLIQNLLLLVVLASICVAVSSSPASVGQETVSVETNNQPTAATKRHVLFDFGHYQQLFHKKYGSRIERAFRKVLFLARAIMAYVSGVAYKFWKSTYYLAVNEFSDWTGKELDTMMNKAGNDRDHSKGDKSRLDASETIDASELNVLQDPEKAASELENKIEQTFDGDLLEQSRCKRRKRDLTNSADDQAGQLANLRPRRISLDDLLKDEEPKAEQEHAATKFDRSWRRLLPTKYKFWTKSTKTKSLVEQQVKVTKKTYKTRHRKRPAISKPTIKSDETLSFMAMIGKAQAALASFVPRKSRCNTVRADQIGSTGQDLPDEMFADLRKSGCMLQPKGQRKCGSCYAFAGITMAEYYHCKATGELVEFSEQYMVDCGNGRFKEMVGCNGGIPYNSPDFIHNYGLELAELYPYVGSEKLCPYPFQSDIKETGFIRMELENFLEVPVDAWPGVLEHSPIYVSVGTPEDFAQYGGGVYDGLGCAELINHAMVVVGHGREFGQEFWLLRNSYGVRWGDWGYFKLAKSAPERCIEFSQGYVYGTKDGINYNIEPVVNLRNGGVISLMQSQ